MSLLSSFAAVGMFSSLTFHLALWGLAIILLPLLGIDWLEPFSSIQPPLQASLGEEEIIDRLAFVEINTQLTGDATEGPTNIEQMAQQLQQSESGWLKSAVDDIWKNQSQSDDQDATANTGRLLKIHCVHNPGDPATAAALFHHHRNPPAWGYLQIPHFRFERGGRGF
ncbi:MAG: hypothetical protein ACO3FE_04335 [Planctomycetaceae bacterium]